MQLFLNFELNLMCFLSRKYLRIVFSLSIVHSIAIRLSCQTDMNYKTCHESCNLVWHIIRDLQKELRLLRLFTLNVTTINFKLIITVTRLMGWFPDMNTSSAWRQSTRRANLNHSRPSVVLSLRIPSVSITFYVLIISKHFFTSIYSFVSSFSTFLLSSNAVS